MSQLSHHLGARVATLTQRISHLTAQEALGFVADAYPDMAAPFLYTAAQLAAQWYNEQPSAGPTPFTAKPQPLQAPDRLKANARWAVLQGDPAEAFRGSAERAVFDSARQTIVYNATKEPGATYARYASATACGFCRILATREPVYSTAYAATRVVGRGGRPRGTQDLGDKYHDHCKCIAAVVRPGESYQPPDYVAQWAAEYKDAVKQAKRDRKDGTAIGAVTFKELCNRMDQISRDQQAQRKKTSAPVSA